MGRYHILFCSCTCAMEAEMSKHCNGCLSGTHVACLQPEVFYGTFSVRLVD